MINNKYELAIINEFYPEWLEDLENEKLNIVQLVLKTTLQAAYLVSLVLSINGISKEDCSNENLLSSTYIFTKEITEETFKLSKLMQIISRK